MKKYLFLLIFILISLPLDVSAQIEVFKKEYSYEEISFHTYGMQKQLILEEIVINEVNETNQHPKYRLIYKDYRYPSILSLEMVYIDTKESLLDIKRLIEEGFSSKEKDYSVSFKMGDELMTVSRVKTLGISSIYILIDKKGFTPQLSKAAWERFFSKI